METITEEKKKLLKVTFYCYSNVLKKAFENVYYYSDSETGIANYKMFARSMNWQVKSVKQFTK